LAMQFPYSGATVRRACGAPSAAPGHPRLIGMHSLVLQPDDPAHSVQALLHDARNLNERGHIWPEMQLNHDRKTERTRVGKCNNSCWKTPHKTGKKRTWSTEISKLSEKGMAIGGIKEQIALLFEKNTIYHVFFSWTSVRRNLI